MRIAARGRELYGSYIDIFWHFLLLLSMRFISFLQPGTSP
jgi:hypothetical protein